jgi:hypothetical protein
MSYRRLSVLKTNNDGIILFRSLRGNNIKELKPEHLIKFPELEEL